ncbi:MAG: DUF4097 family beta strand repeat protein [Acidobacteria bacterium]|jgi:hypothetical protein|nr:DUF4097 family beta strand repeat protein [Acidobacteriota bacterium]
MATIPPIDPRFQREQWRQQQRIARDQAKAQRDAWRAQARLQREQMRWQMRQYRRGSIVGPLLLVAIGIVFLLIQTGRIAANQFWNWYGHFWPLVLIAIGVLMLAEWAVDRYLRAGDAPPVRRSVGGVVFLVILLAFVSLAYTDSRRVNGWVARSFHVSSDNWDEFTGDKHESDLTPVEQAFPEGGTLTVDNPRGDLTIAGTSDDGKLHITGHKEVYSDSDSEAERKAKAIDPNISASGNSVVVNIAAEKGCKLDLDITVPATALVTATANHGELHVRNLKAPVNLTANHGNVDISAITGTSNVHINNNDSSLNAHSLTGSLNIEGKIDELSISDVNGPVQMNGDFFGAGRIERVQGPFQLRTSRTEFRFVRLDGHVDIDPDHDMTVEDVLGPVVLNTRSRDIVMNRVAGDVTVTNKNGTVEIGVAQPVGNVTVTNRSGDVKLTVPEKAGYTISAETKNGSTDTDLPLDRNSSGDRHMLSGSINGGGKQIRILNSESDISINRNTLPPIPATPPAPPKITMEKPGAPPAPPAPPAGIDIRDANGTRVIINQNGVIVRDGSKSASKQKHKDKNKDTDTDF